MKPRNKSSRVREVKHWASLANSFSVPIVFYQSFLNCYFFIMFFFFFSLLEPGGGILIKSH